MATVYPGAIDGALTLANDKTDDTITAGDHAPLHNNISDAIIAIETIVGVNPSGSHVSIAAALLDTVFKTPTASQIIRATGDVVGLAVRASAAQNTANVFEVRLANNAVAAYIDKVGALNASGLLVGGSPLNSGHLFDGSTLARLASPAFTGTPTAPTPAGGDSSAKIATTAFVTAALSGGVPSGVILAYPGDVAPAGYALCQGQLVDGTTPTYSTLWAIFGLKFGGTGQAAMRMPDLQGRAVFGLAGGSGHIDVRTIGNHENVSISSRRPTHGTSIFDPSHAHTIKHNNTQSSGGPGVSMSGGNAITDDAGTVNPAYTGITAGPQSGSPVDTVPYLVLNYIIKL